MPRRILEGNVVSDKMDKTVTVLVERRFMHPVYKKYVKRTDKYVAHDEQNSCKPGERVQIQECRPISRRKCWAVLDSDGRPVLPPLTGKAGQTSSANVGTSNTSNSKPAAKSAVKSETKADPTGKSGAGPKKAAAKSAASKSGPAKSGTAKSGQAKGGSKKTAGKEES